MEKTMYTKHAEYADAQYYLYSCAIIIFSSIKDFTICTYLPINISPGMKHKQIQSASAFVPYLRWPSTPNFP